MSRARALAWGLLVAGCHTAGSDWINQPLPGGGAQWETPGAAESTAQTQAAPLPPRAAVGGQELEQLPERGGLEGRVLGRFRNTYYDFPSEGEYSGELVPLFDASCSAIQRVPVEFHDAVCVQGSGRLKSGVTVSFAKRDCACARVCPRTSQKICFEPLDVERFPWGRGAIGEPIAPLLTVAVDDSVIPMKSVLYIPEFDGLPADEARSSLHDGCFIAQDRGLKVKGQHVDVFTGRPEVTRLWNQLVPSNQGVTVVLDSPRCRPQN